MDKNKKKAVSRVSRRSKGERASSMKTSGFPSKFIPSMKHIQTGWSAAERKDLFHFMFDYVRDHELRSPS